MSNTYAYINLPAGRQVPHLGIEPNNTNKVQYTLKQKRRYGLFTARLSPGSRW
jgi:hypothetical protein